MTPRPSPTETLLPLAPADFQLLLVLLDGELHAYGITKAVERQRKGRVPLEIGSLYRMLSRLLEQGLVEERPAKPHDTGVAARRRYYRITPLGRRVAKAEAARLRDVLEVARAKDLLPARRSASP